MSADVVMPSLGLVMESGKIIRWLKNEGETIKKGEPILEIQTDKVTVEVQATADGILNIRAKPGDVVPVGNIIAKLMTLEEYKAIDSNGDITIIENDQTTALADICSFSFSETPTYLSSNTSEVVKVEGSKEKGETSLIKASPAAKKKARELSLDLLLITGTGPGGRITQDDVIAYYNQSEKRAISAMVEKIVPFTTSRKLTAERMYNSCQLTAPVTLTATVRMDKVVQLRSELNSLLDEDYKVSYDAIFAKAVAITLNKYPDLQAQWTENGLFYPDGIHIGIAVALPQMLVKPVISHCENRSLVSIAKEAQKMISLAKEGKLLPKHLENGTFTISNLGMYHINNFTPIINQPEAAILGIGGIKEQPLITNGNIVIGKTTELSLTFDHRIVDGAPASEFLYFIKRLLEEPYSLFIDQ